jgi:hypothetical protein
MILHKSEFNEAQPPKRSKHNNGSKKLFLMATLLLKFWRRGCSLAAVVGVAKNRPGGAGVLRE